MRLPWVYVQNVALGDKDGCSQVIPELLKPLEPSNQNPLVSNSWTATFTFAMALSSSAVPEIVVRLLIPASPFCGARTAAVGQDTSNVKFWLVEAFWLTDSSSFAMTATV